MLKCKCAQNELDRRKNNYKVFMLIFGVKIIPLGIDSRPHKQLSSPYWDGRLHDFKGFLLSGILS